MRSLENKTLLATLMASLLAFFGCGKSKESSSSAEPQLALVEEIPIKGFDPEGEPVIRKWSDGSISLHFEAMPPFFAEKEGKESEFDQFELEVQKALAVPVVRLDREVFAIKKPAPDTADQAKKWLEGFKNQR